MVRDAYQNFGIEIELTGLTRQKAAEVVAAYFGTEAMALGDVHSATFDTGTEQSKNEIILLEVYIGNAVHYRYRKANHKSRKKM